MEPVETGECASGPPRFEASLGSSGLDAIHARRSDLVRLAYRFLWDIHDAEDAVQSALLQAECKQDQVADRSRAWGWVRSIVVRQCHDIRRRSRRVQRLAAEVRERAEQPAPPDHAAGLEREEMQQRLRSLIAMLPEQQQTAVVLRHLEQMDFASIGEIMQVSAVTARVHARNGREALRRMLSKQSASWVEGFAARKEQ